MGLNTYSTHFCGCGGACYGIEQAGLSCVKAIDYLDFAVEYREKNIGHKATLMDISEYEPAPEDAADLLWTSPPCQTISSSAREKVNQRAKLRTSDIRDTLVLASVRYAMELRPKYVVVENVMGLMTRNASKNGDGMMNDWRKAFEAIGYHTEWNVLNSADFGVPQRRERVFIVASREGKKGLIPKEPKAKRTTLADIMENGVLDHAWGAPTYVTAYNKVTKLALKHGEFGIDILSGKDLFPTVTCGWGGGATRKKVAVLDETPDGVPFLRHPTVREGARAQGFPDSWVFPESDSKAWTLIGNAVASPVSKAIVEHLKLVEDGACPPAKTEIPPQAPNYVNMGGASTLGEIDYEFGDQP